MEETIDLRELFQILKKRFALIVVIAFLATVISGVFSFFFITPIFQSSTELVVTSSAGENQITTTDIQSSLQLINTYSDILRSPAIMDIVAEELGLNMRGSQLRNIVSVSNSSNSQIITLSVQNEDAALAADIANTTAEVFQREIGGIMHVDNVSILAEAEMPTGPVSPRPMLNMALALVVGVMIGVGLSFLLEYLDKTVKTGRDIEELLDLPIVGVIPRITEESMNK